MKEIWKDVEGVFGYQVSNLGRVRSLFSRGGKRAYPRVMKGHIDSHGYVQVTISVDGKSKLMFVHILVAKAFIPNPLGKRTINHINCNKTDNRVCNLEWATDSENIKHAFAHGKKPIKAQLGKYGFESSRGIPIQQIDRHTKNVINIFGSALEAYRETGVNKSDILSCVHGKLKSAGGYIWERFIGQKLNGKKY